MFVPTDLVPCFSVYSVVLSVVIFSFETEGAGPLAKHLAVCSGCGMFLFVCSSSRYRRFCLFVLRFNGPVNPMGSCRARSVYLTTRLLGRLSPLSG